MQQAASRCRCERGGGGARSLGSPTRVHLPREPRHRGAGGSPGGDPAPSTGRQLPGPVFPPCSVWLFPYGFPGLPPCRGAVLTSRSPRLPVPLPSRYWLYLAPARSQCRLFLASPAAAGKGPRGVVLHCRRWVFGLAGAVSRHVGPPWGAALVLLPLPGSLPAAVVTHQLSGSRRELGLAKSSSTPKPLPAASAPRFPQAPSRSGRLCHPEPALRCHNPSTAPAPCTAPGSAGTGDGQHGAAPLPGQTGRCQRRCPRALTVAPRLLPARLPAVSQASGSGPSPSDGQTGWTIPSAGSVGSPGAPPDRRLPRRVPTLRPGKPSLAAAP